MKKIFVGITVLLIAWLVIVVLADHKLASKVFSEDFILFILLPLTLGIFAIWAARAIYLRFIKAKSRTVRILFSAVVVLAALALLIYAYIVGGFILFFAF